MAADTRVSSVSDGSRGKPSIRTSKTLDPSATNKAPPKVRIEQIDKFKVFNDREALGVYKPEMTPRQIAAMKRISRHGSDSEQRIAIALLDLQDGSFSGHVAQRANASANLLERWVSTLDTMLHGSALGQTVSALQELDSDAAPANQSFPVNDEMKRALAMARSGNSLSEIRLATGIDGYDLQDTVVALFKERRRAVASSQVASVREMPRRASAVADGKTVPRPEASVRLTAFQKRLVEAIELTDAAKSRNAELDVAERCGFEAAFIRELAETLSSGGKEAFVAETSAMPVRMPDVSSAQRMVMMARRSSGAIVGELHALAFLYDGASFEMAARATGLEVSELEELALDFATFGFEALGYQNKRQATEQLQRAAKM